MSGFFGVTQVVRLVAWDVRVHRVTFSGVRRGAVGVFERGGLEGGF